jgi:tetratricopeptide (TPR) repeat protein
MQCPEGGSCGRSPVTEDPCENKTVIDHPTPDELTALAHGGLPPKRALEVTLHLAEGCPSCRPAALPVLGPAAEAEAGESSSRYSDVVQRALQTALRQRESHGREREKSRQIAAELAAGGPEVLAGIRQRESGAPLLEALLERSWSLRYQDPGAMLEHARLATTVAAELDLGPDGARRAADLRCRAWAELGNALRIVEDLDGAEEAFDTALGHWTVGTHEETLFARYLDLRASLHRARRDFASAQAALAVACSIYLRYGQRHLAGRTLLNQANFACTAGEPEAALQLIAKGLSLVEESLDPELVTAAIHNQMWFLVDCGRYDEARKLLFLNRWRYQQAEGRLHFLRLRWLEGRIDAGRGQLARAEAAFQESREGFEALGLGYKAATVALDLATAILRQGRATEASSLVLEAAEAFTALRIQREMLMAVLYLKEAFVCGAAELPLLEEVSAFLRRAEHDASVRFEPRP